VGSWTEVWYYDFGCLATWPSGKARVCKILIPRFESGCRLDFDKLNQPEMPSL
jgi:hypothetical protein